MLTRVEDITIEIQAFLSRKHRLLLLTLATFAALC